MRDPETIAWSTWNDAGYSCRYSKAHIEDPERPGRCLCGARVPGPETPLTIVHLENMRRLAYAGASLLPPVPAFYIGGGDFDRFLDHYALRVLDRFGLHDPGEAGLRWEGPGE